MFRSTVYNVSMNDRPLQEPTFLLLTALAGGPQHGYGIMTDVERLSGGRVKLRAGTLYAALDRVVAEGLVEADREEVVDGRLRRYYRLTPPGGDRLAAEVERLQHNAAVADKRLKLRRRAIGDLA
jgi:DNA-binding PadR family transcriptional regulator